MYKPINYISVLVVFLLVYNTDICNYYYLDIILKSENDYPLLKNTNLNPFNNAWWHLRGQIVNCVWGLAFIAATLEKTKFSRVIFWIGINFCINEAHGRMQGERTRSSEDWAIVIVTIAITLIDVFYREVIISFIEKELNKLKKWLLQTLRIKK